MNRGWKSAIAVLGATLALVATSAGRERPVILLVVDGKAGALVPRLTAELETLGFTVVRAPSTRASLATQARAKGADAVIRVPPSHRALSVWVTDPAHTRDTARETELPGDGVDDDVLAVRSVELLRAAFLEIDVAMPVPRAIASAAVSASSAAPAASSSPPPAPAASSSAAPTPLPPSAPPALSPAPAPPSHALFVEGGATWSPGGVPTQAHLIVGGARALGTHVHAAAWLSTPGVGGSIHAADGDADARTTMVALELRADARAAEARLSLGAGAGGLWLRTTGRPTARDATGQVDDAVVPWSFLLAGVGYGVSSRTILRGDLRVGATWAATRVTFSGREVATFGRPLWAPAFGLEVALD